jgi:magnesium-transporting ATPase (P-type)
MSENKENNNKKFPENVFSQPAPSNLPNSTAVLVLGILTIVLSIWYFSPLGLICGIIALALGRRDLALYAASPEKYSLSSFNNLKAGRVCAIIGIIVAVIFFIFLLLILFGVLATLPFWGMID